MIVNVTEGSVEIISTREYTKSWEIAYRKDGKYLNYLIKKYWNEFDDETKSKIKKFFEKELNEF